MPDPDRVKYNCPYIVEGHGENNHDCNNDAKSKAPVECRKYYGHCFPEHY